MKNVVLALVVLVACKASTKQRPSDPPSTAAGSAASTQQYDCNAALANFDRMIDPADATPDQRTKIKQAVIDRCVADSWSGPALTCMRGATSSPATFDCWSQLLTKEQRDAARAALGNLPK